MFEIKQAKRMQAKLKVGINGPSGSGKTYSALLLARGMASGWEKIVVIDTENGSADLYSNIGGYNTLTMTPPFSPERYIEAIAACEQSGMEVIVIDSVSHEWDGKGGCLEINESLAQAKFRGNTWSAWSETTPRHQKFLQAILQSSCHVITTSRAKTETVMTEDKKVKKLGMKEIQRDGFEYELTLSFLVDRDTHAAVASKDRTGIFEGRDPFVISEETGEKLRAWTESGAKDMTMEERGMKRKELGELLAKLGRTEEWYLNQIKKTFPELTLPVLDQCIAKVKEAIVKKEEEAKERERQTVEEGRATVEEEARMEKVTA